MPRQRGQGGQAGGAGGGAGRWCFPPSQGLAQSAALSQDQGAPPQPHKHGHSSLPRDSPLRSGPAGSRTVRTLTAAPSKSPRGHPKPSQQNPHTDGEHSPPPQSQQEHRLPARQFPLKTYWPHKQPCHSEQGDT